MRMSSPLVSQQTNVKNADMNATVARTLTSSAGFETVTKAEIEIWAKVERAISGKNIFGQMLGDVRHWPSGPRQGSPAFPMDTPDHP